MEGKLTLGFIGAGAMGGAIARGLVESGAIPACQVSVSDPNPQIRDSFAELGCAVFADASCMLAEFDPRVAFVAVKPQILAAVVGPLAEALSTRLVVSIAAGVKVATIEGMLGEGARVVRCMPNMPMQVRSGAAAICGGACATADDVELVRSLFESISVARVMREDQVDVAGIVFGSSPAFFALFVDQLARAGVEAGLPAADAREMIEATMKGVATQLLESGMHPREYMEKISSPGGTTIVATRQLEGRTFEAICDAVDAARARTRELAGE